MSEIKTTLITDPTRHQGVLALLAESDAYFAALYPPASNHLEDGAALSRSNVSVYGIERDGVLVACGAVKIMMDDGIYGEIKRVFVKSDWRRHGFAGAIMEQLHEHLRAGSVSLARLETGRNEAATLAFYQNLGYRERPPFGAYRPDPLSIFMEKPIF